MPCLVTINKVFGVVSKDAKSPGTPSWIIVEGTARGCQRVMVHTDYSDPDGITVKVNYRKDQDEGNWTVKLPVLEGAKCECGSDVRVRTISSPYNPECQGVNLISKKLKCIEE